MSHRVSNPTQHTRQLSYSERRVLFGIRRFFILFAVLAFLLFRRSTNKPHQTSGSLSNDEGVSFLALSEGDNHIFFNAFDVDDQLLNHVTVKEWRGRTLRDPSNVERYEAYTGVAGPWFSHTNVCVNERDGIMYFDGESREYAKNARITGAAKAGLPYRPIPFPWSDKPGAHENGDAAEYSDDSGVFILLGQTLMVHCWRMYDGLNPLHFLFGYGAVFSILSAVQGDFETMDHVIFHQCPIPYTGGDFHKVLWEIVLKEALERRLFNPSTRFYTTTEKRLLCMENVRDNGWMDLQPYRPGPFSEGPPYMGADTRTFQYWKRKFVEYLKERRPAVLTILEEQIRKDLQLSSPRIVLYQRDGGSQNGKRQFTNLLEIESLVHEYTEKYEVITVNTGSKLEDIITIFNSFDIAIIPHGSHIVNFLFTVKPHKIAVIEVVGSCQHYALSLWLDHRMFYHISGGHKAPIPEIQAFIDSCEAIRETVPCGPNCKLATNCTESETTCTTEQLLNTILKSDLTVDNSKLRADLNRAIAEVLDARNREVTLPVY